MPWGEIITLLSEVLLECLENRSRGEVLGGIRRFGGIEEVVLRRAMRKKGWSRKQTRKSMQKLRREHGKASLEDLEALLDTADTH